MQDTFIPLHIEKPTRVLQRVAYRLIVADYKRNPHRYGYPPAGMDELSREVRTFFPSAGHFIQAAARCCASGLTLRQWRDATYAPDMRVIYKRRLPRP